MGKLSASTGLSKAMLEQHLTKESKYARFTWAPPPQDHVIDEFVEAAIAAEMERISIIQHEISLRGIDHVCSTLHVSRAHMESYLAFSGDVVVQLDVGDKVVQMIENEKEADLLLASERHPQVQQLFAMEHDAYSRLFNRFLKQADVQKGELAKRIGLPYAMLTTALKKPVPGEYWKWIPCRWLVTQFLLRCDVMKQKSDPVTALCREIGRTDVEAEEVRSLLNDPQYPVNALWEQCLIGTSTEEGSCDVSVPKPDLSSTDLRLIYSQHQRCWNEDRFFVSERAIAACRKIPYNDIVLPDHLRQCVSVPGTTIQGNNLNAYEGTSYSCFKKADGVQVLSTGGILAALDLLHTDSERIVLAIATSQSTAFHSMEAEGEEGLAAIQIWVLDTKARRFAFHFAIAHNNGTAFSLMWIPPEAVDRQESVHTRLGVLCATFTNGKTFMYSVPNCGKQDEALYLDPVCRFLIPDGSIGLSILYLAMKKDPILCIGTNEGSLLLFSMSSPQVLVRPIQEIRMQTQ